MVFQLDLQKRINMNSIVELLGINERYSNYSIFISRSLHIGFQKKFT